MYDPSIFQLDEFNPPRCSINIVRNLLTDQRFSDEEIMEEARRFTRYINLLVKIQIEAKRRERDEIEDGPIWLG